MSTLYASFKDASVAERAAGALLDNGAEESDVSVIAHESYNTLRGQHAQAEALDAEKDAKHGISTTTPADVAAGAVKGAAAGIGIGAIALAASLFIPGVGLVLGTGALATALAGAAGTVAAGAAAGGVTGYLKDQGVPDDVVTRYSNTFYEGGAILAVAVPTGKLDAAEAEALMVKYGAVNVATYNSNRVMIDQPGIVEEKVPLVVDKPNIDPIEFVDRGTTPVVVPGTAAVVHDTVTGADVVVPTAPATVIAGAPVPGSQIVTDPVTGTNVVVPPAHETVVVQETVVAPSDIIVDPVTGVATRTIVDPVTGSSRTVIVDAATGRPLSSGVVETASVVDASGRVLEPPHVVNEPDVVIGDIDETRRNNPGPRLI